MEAKRLYLSGKISGDENFMQKFAGKEKELTEKGFLVFNPAKHPNMFSWEDFMELDLLALKKCDSVYFMSDWKDSRGAKIEYEEAVRLGKEIFFEEKEREVKHSKVIPKKTAVGYKVFYLKNGKLYPPMVANPGGADTPVGCWIDASAGDIAGTTKTGRPQIEKGGNGTHCSKGFLAYRPGWHLGTVPIARQFEKTNPLNGKKELFPREFVWAECEYACDVDYQESAMKAGMTESGAFRHSYAGLQKIPENGYYRYRTNPDPNTEEWIITGAIKVNRILTNREVDEICRRNGRIPQKREEDVLREMNRKSASKSKEREMER